MGKRIMDGGQRRVPKSNFGKIAGASTHRCPIASIIFYVGPRFGPRRLEPCFCEDFNDSELDMVGDLLHTLRGHRPSLEDDSVMWRQGRNGLFGSRKLTGSGQAECHAFPQGAYGWIGCQLKFAFCLGGYVGKVLTRIDSR
ncbi:hypothetical protein AAG906_021096 [Vitis piasezkii]